MVTADTALANVESLWKSVNGGVTWYRILSLATAANNGQIRLSESYATDNTLAFINVANATFQISMDGGSTWTPRTVPTAGFTVADMIIKDAYTYYVGNAAAANVQATTNGGWTWQIGPTALTGGTAVNDMAYDAATGHILVGDTVGGAYLSTNANLTYLAQGVIGGPTIVEFDINYATNNIIYGADNNAAGVLRYNTTTPLIPWAAIDGSVTLLPADIICAPDGALYATDATASTVPVPPAVGAGGMMRSLNPTAPITPASPAFERVTGADALAAGSTLGKMTLTEGSNIIYAINGALISTYTDILTMAVPTILSPAEGDIVLAAAAAVSITPVENNPPPVGTYQVQWNTRSDYLGAGNILAIPAVINAVNLNTLAIPVPAGSTIYVRVQTTGPVFGPWSDTVSYETQLTAGAINAPAILSPIAGGTGPGGYNAELNPTFNWGVIGGATNYKFQLAMDASFDDPIVDETLGNVLVYKLESMTLDYGTTYYWRVMAISATSETAWSAAVGFTTMAEPAETEPPVTVTDAPDVIITIPPAEPAPTITLEPTPIEETPAGYIWAIIIIGAVLVIAVIVLIVRTRRSV
jgi:uncharacterized integral membrane protein